MKSLRDFIVLFVEVEQCFEPSSVHNVVSGKLGSTAIDDFPLYFDGQLEGVSTQSRRIRKSGEIDGSNYSVNLEVRLQKTRLSFLASL
jgi:hypothetical protein